MERGRLLDIGVKLMLTTALVILFVLHFQEKDSLVYVDAQKLVVGYKGMQAARAEFESKVADWQSNLDTLKQEMQVRLTSYEKAKPGLSSSARKQEEEAIAQKQQAYSQYEQAVTSNVQRANQELSKQVLDKVNGYLKKYGQEKGVKIILAATQYGNIVYAEEGIDVTDDVMKGLNSEFSN